MDYGPALLTKKELLRVEQPPKHIFQLRAPIFAGLNCRNQKLEFCGSRRSAKRCPKQFLDEFLIRFARFKQSSNSIVLVSHQFRCSRSAQHLKSLAHIALAGTLRIRTEEPRRFAENFQKLIRRIRPSLAFALGPYARKLCCSHSDGIACEFQGHATDLAFAIEQLFGPEPASEGVRKVDLIMLVSLVWRRRQLIRVRIHEQANKPAGIELMFHKIVGELVQ